jgi:hypothetical protein
MVHTAPPWLCPPHCSPSLSPPPQDVDKNGDGRISLDEFSRAFSSGGVPGLPGSGTLGHPDQVQRMKDAGELDDFTVRAGPLTSVAVRRAPVLHTHKETRNSWAARGLVAQRYLGRP